MSVPLAAPAPAPSSNPVADWVAGFQDLVAQVPDLVQPLIVALAATVPFIEGELGAVIGVIGGLHPLLAASAAVAGNFLCVLLIAFLGARARGAITGRARAGAEEKPLSKGRLRFQRWFNRFGVAGASLLGPLAIPTQFTTATLVAAGVPMRRVVLWQAVAIVLWTTVTTVSAILALAVAT